MRPNILLHVTSLDFSQDVTFKTEVIVFTYITH